MRGTPIKRLSFFLGVFSMGLVAFLVLTGQFGSSEENSTLPSFELEELAPLTRNQVTFRSHDPIRGRLRFVLKGDLDISSGVTFSSENLTQQRTLVDTTIELPVYTNDPNTPSDQILLEAEKVITHQQGEERAQVDGLLNAKGAGGSPELETRDIQILWSEGEGVFLSGSSPVRMMWPELELRGINGLSGSIGSESGLEQLIFAPPILMALTASGSGPFIENSTSPGENQVRIICEGPLVLGESGRGARFDGSVKIFETPSSAPMNPEVDVPVQHIAADYLDMELDPFSRRLKSIRSEQKENPITVFLDATTRIQGSNLNWEEGSDFVELTGDVIIDHPAGRFMAARARVLTGASRCILDGGLEGILQGPATGESNALGPEGGHEWLVEADRAEFAFGSGSLKELKATHTEGRSVVIREQRKGGATLRGDSLTWNADSRELQITSTSEKQCTFAEGENRITSNSIAFTANSPMLIFRDAVEAELIEWPEGRRNNSRRWLGDGARGQIRADELSLVWDALQRLDTLKASAAETPLEMNIEGEVRLSVKGSELSWRGQEGVLELMGAGRQEIHLVDRARLWADHLVLSTLLGQASGLGAVRGQFLRPGEPDDFLELNCDELIAQFAEKVLPQDSENSKSGSRRWGEISAVRSLGSEDRPVQIEDKNLRAEGQEFLWNAKEDTFRFQGPGRQKVEVASDDSLPGFIDASQITINRGESNILLEGQAKASIYLASNPGEMGEQSENPLIWTLDAQRIQSEVDLESTPIRLKSVEGKGGVVLLQEQGQLEFRGQLFRWDQKQQRLTLTSEDGQGLQTFSRGKDPRDEIVAREVVLVRTTSSGTNPQERLEALLSSVLSAVIHLQGKDNRAPGKVDLRSEELLLTLKEGLGDTTIRAHEALAWGSVDLRGGDYRILSERARILARNRTVELTGSSRQQVQVFRDGVSSLPPSRAVKLTQERGGYRVESLPRAGGWSMRDIETSLGRMGRLDRRPSP